MSAIACVDCSAIDSNIAVSVRLGRMLHALDIQDSHAIDMFIALRGDHDRYSPDFATEDLSERLKCFIEFLGEVGSRTSRKLPD